ncbi:MAG: hypothetical protein IPJ03_02475 [Ignavibacteriales bacterium]|nr:hypothetical protein [Ignavibacteriales bacterium]
MILLSKYRCGIGKAFLLVYFLFLGVSVFHFHHISFLNESSYKNESPQRNNTDIVLSGITFCQLAQFSSSIFNLDYSADKQLSIKYFSVPALLTTNEVLVSNFYNLVNPLRGPPSFS